MVTTEAQLAVKKLKRHGPCCWNYYQSINLFSNLKAAQYLDMFIRSEAYVCVYCASSYFFLFLHFVV